VPKIVVLRYYAPVSGEPKFCRRSILLRDRFRCCYCGEPFSSPDLTYDHVIPRSLSKAALATAGWEAKGQGDRLWLGLLRRRDDRAGMADGVGRPLLARYRLDRRKVRTRQYLAPGDRYGGLALLCAATISLVHPKQRDDEPMIEIYFEKPDQGHVGSAYAFRSLMMTRG